MLSEPKSKHKSASEIYSFEVLNHTLSSHIATLTVFLNRKPETFEQQGFKLVIGKVLALLEQEGNNLKGADKGTIVIEIPEEFRLQDPKMHLMDAERLNEDSKSGVGGKGE